MKKIVLISIAIAAVVVGLGLYVINNQTPGIITDGDSSTVEAMGVDKNYDWAVMKAIENAVRQSTPITVSKNGVDQQIDFNIFGNKIEGYIKEINSKYSGQILSYKVISTEQKKGLFYVTISAVIKQDEKIAEYKSPDLSTGAKPTVVVFDFKGNNSFVCGGSRISLKTVNKDLNFDLNEKMLQTKKFKMLSRNNFSEYQKELSLIMQGLTQNIEKSRLQHILSADYILAGEVLSVDTQDLTTKVEMLGEQYDKTRYNMTIGYTLFETATMEIKSSLRVNSSITVDQAARACSGKLKKLSNDVSNKVVKQIMSDLFNEEKQVVKNTEQPKKNNVVYVKEAEKTPVKLPFDK